MVEILTILIGAVILLFAFLIGNMLANITREELKDGKKWFKLIIIVGLIGSIVSVFYKNDVLFFSFLFIVLVTTRSLLK